MKFSEALIRSKIVSSKQTDAVVLEEKGKYYYYPRGEPNSKRKCSPTQLFKFAERFDWEIYKDTLSERFEKWYYKGDEKNKKLAELLSDIVLKVQELEEKLNERT